MFSGTQWKLLTVTFNIIRRIILGAVQFIQHILQLILRSAKQGYKQTVEAKSDSNVVTSMYPNSTLSAYFYFHTLVTSYLHCRLHFLAICMQLKLLILQEAFLRLLYGISTGKNASGTSNTISLTPYTINDNIIKKRWETFFVLFNIGILIQRNELLNILCETCLYAVLGYLVSYKMKWPHTDVSRNSTEHTGM